VFAAVAIGTLGLGIGVNTAIFSAAREALSPRLPFADSERLVRIYQVPEAGSARISPRVPAFLAIRNGADAFESVAASRFTDLILTTPDGPERVIGNVITPGWLETLGVEPVLGRAFTTEEEATGQRSGVVVISHGMWQRRFGGRRDVLASVLNLNGSTYAVIGVLPRGFNYPYEAEVWIPFRPEDDTGEAFWALNLKGRLRSGVSVATATEELENLSRQVGGTLPGFSSDMTLMPVSIREVLVGGEGRTVTALSAAVGFLLLLVCANLASLLLSRGLNRQAEFALRSSLGASRVRLIRQSLVESLVLGAAGGVVGITLAAFGVGILDPLLPEDLLTLGTGIAIDRGVLSFAMLVSLLTGIALGVLPAVRLSATSPGQLLRSGAVAITGPRKQRIGGALVVGELAVTLMLLTGVGLMVRDLQRLQSIDLGYDQNGMVVFTVGLDRAPYLDGPRRVQFANQLIGELTASPAVRSAGATTTFPRHRGNTIASLESEGGMISSTSVPPSNSRYVVPGYLQHLGAVLLRGRWLEGTDRAGGPPVAVVSASLAQRFWPDQDPIGHRLRNRRDGDGAPWHTVVGVVVDVRESDEITGTWYVPYAQHAHERNAAQLTFAVRGVSPNDPPSLAIIERAVRAADPGLPVFDATTVQRINVEAVGRERYGTLLGSGFATFGLLLAALGLYGAVSYSVARRGREFGLRLALGGERRMILRDVLGQVVRLVLAGAVVGLGGALATARVIGANLSEVGSFDPIAFGVALVLLTVTALAAGAIPAWRAMRIDPVVSLRAD
jgi:putative ABC transport system permease protein